MAEEMPSNATTKLLESRLLRPALFHLSKKIRMIRTDRKKGRLTGEEDKSLAGIQSAELTMARWGHLGRKGYENYYVIIILL